MLQIQVRNRFWSSLTIGRPGILNTADYAVTNNNRPFSDYTFLCEIHIKNGLHLGSDHLGWNACFKFIKTISEVLHNDIINHMMMIFVLWVVSLVKFSGVWLQGMAKWIIWAEHFLKLTLNLFCQLFCDIISETEVSKEIPAEWQSLKSADFLAETWPPIACIHWCHEICLWWFSPEKFTGLGPENRCSSWLYYYVTMTIIAMSSSNKSDHLTILFI